jgi:hypothetical protein
MYLLSDGYLIPPHTAQVGLDHLEMLKMLCHGPVYPLLNTASSKTPAWPLHPAKPHLGILFFPWA